MARARVEYCTLYLNLSAVRGTVFDGGRLPPTIEEFDGALAAYEQGGRTAFVPTYPGWWPQAWAGFFGGCWADEDGSFTPGRPGNVRVGSGIWTGSRQRLQPYGWARRARTRFYEPPPSLGSAR
ncbi:MAG: hypothetical protein WD024_05975 [Bacillota bacterium]